jgi:hypothetical protein
VWRFQEIAGQIAKLETALRPVAFFACLAGGQHVASAADVTVALDKVELDTHVAFDVRCTSAWPSTNESLHRRMRGVFGSCRQRAVRSVAPLRPLRVRTPVIRSLSPAEGISRSRSVSPATDEMAPVAAPDRSSDYRRDSSIFN